MLRHLFAIITIVLLVLATIQIAEAFWVGSKSKDLTPIHESITHDALRNFQLELSNRKIVGFWWASRSQIARFNKEADNDQTPSHHFDNDLFAEASLRLIQLRSQLVSELDDQAFRRHTDHGALRRKSLVKNAHYYAGEALHTIQDFYSHTNWVERYGEDQRDLLDTFGKGKVIGGFAPAVCDNHNLEGSPLTSGWALGGEDGLLNCIRPINKCPHGFILRCDKLDGELVGALGLNKDYPARPNHYKARRLATQATEHFIREILKEILSAPSKLPPGIDRVLAQNAANLAVCEFMGVPDALVNCLTTYELKVKKLNKENNAAIPQGIVVSELDEINCGDTCEFPFVAGTATKLIASDFSGFKFTKWADDSEVCSGSETATCEVTMDSDKVAKAVFEQPCNKFQQHILAGTGRWMLTLYQDNTRSIPRQQEYYEFYDTGRFQQYRLVFYDQEGNVTSDRPSTLTAPWTLGSCDDVALLTLNGFIYFDITPDLPNSLIGFYSRGNNVMDMIRLN